MSRQRKFGLFSLVICLILFWARQVLPELTDSQMTLVNFAFSSRGMRLMLLSYLLFTYDICSVLMATTEADEINAFLWTRKIGVSKAYMIFAKRFANYFLPFIVAHLMLLNSLQLLLQLLALSIWLLLWVILTALEFVKIASPIKKASIGLVFLVARMVILLI